jgi:phosphoribosylcarboxyaminoimidazole (NCAIR) mutase
MVEAVGIEPLFSVPVCASVRGFASLLPHRGAPEPLPTATNCYNLATCIGRDSD